MYVLLAMMFCHIVDDFYLQGILCDMKQQKWWLDHKQYSDKYKNDYKFALLVHGFSWAFVMMLPIAIVFGFNVGADYGLILFVNGLIHSYIDDLKANKLKISLIQDQCWHMTQILWTFIYFALA